MHTVINAGTRVIGAQASLLNDSHILFREGCKWQTENFLTVPTMTDSLTH